ncbi:MAG: NUDIX domain-containing protein [Spirochaetia bacterium]
MKRYAFCPVCGSALGRPAGSAAHVNLLTCGSCKFEFWQNSKPAVGAIIVRTVGGNPHLLLCRRGIEPYKGMWDLPGGYLNNGEHPEEGLLREIREELGTSLERQKFLTVEIDEYPREDVAEEARFVLGLYYVCEIKADARLTPMDDAWDAEWFPLEELPDGIAFTANLRAIEAFKRTLAMRAEGDPHSG